MELFYYRRLDVYKDAKQLAINVNEALKSFPKEERYALTNQLQRASTSVMAWGGGCSNATVGRNRALKPWLKIRSPVFRFLKPSAMPCCKSLPSGLARRSAAKLRRAK